MRTRIDYNEAKKLLADPIYVRSQFPVTATDNSNNPTKLKLSSDGNFIRRAEDKYCVIDPDTTDFYATTVEHTRTYLNPGKWNPQAKQPQTLLDAPPIALTAYDILKAVPHIKLAAIPEHQRAIYGQQTYFAPFEDSISLWDKLTRLSIQHNIALQDTSSALADSTDRATIRRYLFGDHTIICKI